MDDPETLLDFEDRADRLMRESPIAALPAWSMMTWMQVRVFMAQHIHGPVTPGMDDGSRLAEVWSHVLGWFGKLEARGEPGTAVDGLRLADEADRGRTHFADLTRYARFCELMPDVHRGNLQARAVERGFELTHSSAELAVAEAIDVVVSELAVTHYRQGCRERLDSGVEAIVASGAPITLSSLAPVIRRFSASFLRDVVEDDLLTEDGMNAVFGFGKETYRAVRSGVLCLAEACHQTAMATCISPANESGGVPDEALAWVSVRASAADVRDAVAAGGHVSPEVASRFLSEFTFDYGEDALARRGGEGFMPPFVRIGEVVLFSPDLALAFCHLRNVLVSMSRLRGKAFDDLVSRDLEPVLVDAVRQALTGLPHVTTRSQTQYRGGDLDLLAIGLDGSDVLVVEAKGTLPPQGSRATARLAGRIQEGLRQLRRFADRPQEERVRIVRDATRLELDHPRFHYLILGRSCMGSGSPWLGDPGFTPATLPLVRLAVRRLRRLEGSSLAQLPAEIEATMRAVVRGARPRWSTTGLRVFGTLLLIPTLDWDAAAVEEGRRMAAA